MLSIRLLTIEDQDPDRIYQEFHSAVADWIFVRKGLLNLAAPDEDDHPWVTNLQDWLDRIGPLCQRHDLVFCTIDIAIPRGPSDDEPDPQHGIALAHEVELRHADGVRGCILTGMEPSRLEQLVGDSLTELMFDFKADHQAGYPNIVGFVKSQVLAELRQLEFETAPGNERLVLMEEESGRLRELYISRVPYLLDPAQWHIPFLIVGAEGLGCSTLLEFISFMGDSELRVIDLDVDSFKQNRRCLHSLTMLANELQAHGDGWPEGSLRRLVHIRHVDRYDPSRCARAGESCIDPLLAILDTLEGLEGVSCPIGFAFNVEGESRLRIRSKQGRGLIKRLEDSISRLTGLHMEHMSLDRSGWVVGHPRVLRLPAVAERGRQHRIDLISAHLARLARGSGKPRLEQRATEVGLADDVFDLFVDKIDWPTAGNLGGLVRAVESSFTHFLEQRGEQQLELTRAHLPPDLRARFDRAVLNMDDVTLHFPQQKGGMLSVVEHADFEVNMGEMLVILGPSGCGKSTLLRIFAGLLEPTSGVASYRGDPIEGPSEKIGMVFQDYSLFPWLTVRRNIEFGPSVRGQRREQTFQKVEGLLDVAGLTGFEDSFPAQLSGGMRQRVAIIRALANEPDVLLMDEPFGALDVQTRWQMQDFLLRTRELTGTTVVFVTHDIDEAVFLADRILIATPRPLRLRQPILVPFSTEARTDALRREAVFMAAVGRVREALLEAAKETL